MPSRLYSSCSCFSTNSATTTSQTQFEHLSRLTYEQLLKLFVAVVNAELLETVVVEDLETVDVQNTDQRTLVVFGVVLLVDCDRRVDLVDDPAEQPLVDRFGEGVSSVIRLRFGVFLPHDVPSGGDDAFAQRRSQLVFLHLEQVGDHVDRLLVFHLEFLAVVDEIHVAQVENRPDDPPQSVLRLLGELERAQGTVDVAEVVAVVDGVHFGSFALLHEKVVLGVAGQVEFPQEVVAGADQKLQF